MASEFSNALRRVADEIDSFTARAENAQGIKELSKDSELLVGFWRVWKEVPIDWKEKVSGRGGKLNSSLMKKKIEIPDLQTHMVDTIWGWGMNPSDDYTLTSIGDGQHKPSAPLDYIVCGDVEIQEQHVLLELRWRITNVFTFCVLDQFDDFEPTKLAPILLEKGYISAPYVEKFVKNAIKWQSIGRKYYCLAESLGGFGSLIFLPLMGRSLWETQYTPSSKASPLTTYLLKDVVAKAMKKHKGWTAHDIVNRILKCWAKKFSNSITFILDSSECRTKKWNPPLLLYLKNLHVFPIDGEQREVAVSPKMSRKRRCGGTKLKQPRSKRLKPAVPAPAEQETVSNAPLIHKETGPKNGTTRSDELHVEEHLHYTPLAANQQPQSEYSRTTPELLANRAEAFSNTQIDCSEAGLSEQLRQFPFQRPIESGLSSPSAESPSTGFQPSVPSHEIAGTGIVPLTPLDAIDQATATVQMQNPLVPTPQTALTPDNASTLASAGILTDTHRTALVQPGTYVEPIQQTDWSNPTQQTGWSNPTQQTGWSNPTQQTGWSNPMQQTGWSNPTQQTGWSNPMQQTGWSNPTQQTGWSNPTQQTSWSNPMQQSVQPAQPQFFDTLLRHPHLLQH
ncbi:hypothetical protein FQN57_002591 [Myotisia sp. PD_48]|nr:hypothetical protein FQN57_002591 [Myotisia sp. PD_48]